MEQSSPYLRLFLNSSSNEHLFVGWLQLTSGGVQLIPQKKKECTLSGKKNNSHQITRKFKEKKHMLKYNEEDLKLKHSQVIHEYPQRMNSQ